MTINELILKNDSTKNDVKLDQAYTQLQKLCGLLKQAKLGDAVIMKINTEIDEINSSTSLGKSLLNLIKKKQLKIIRIVEKDSKIVPINYYRNLWLAVGMSAFGLPIGTAIGLYSGNFAFLGVGLPIGLGIGVALGTVLDKKAKAEARQLDIELK